MLPSIQQDRFHPSKLKTPDDMIIPEPFSIPSISNQLNAIGNLISFSCNLFYILAINKSHLKKKDNSSVRPMRVRRVYKYSVE